MPTILDTLKERGFVQQCTDWDALAKHLESGSARYYIGFDATATSLHCGSLVPIMAMAHLQRAGHQPIAVVGGGTTMVGDPSGKTEMRQLLTPEEIDVNAAGILAQLQRYLKLDGESGHFVNNKDWLLPLKYVDFLRDIGRYFKVNEMIKAEAYRARLEREEGLSFIEFNYQLLQAYDFLTLYRTHGCRVQMGGDDQWGNIVAGVDLTRRVERADVFGITFPLLTTARGEKMGKTAGGAIWLDPERLSPYEFYQYWINCDDRDVQRFLALFTFLPMDEVRRLGALKDAAIREAKEVLAFEATTLCHGAAAAEEARNASRSAFSGGAADLDAVPTTEIAASRLAEGLPLVAFLADEGIFASRGEARRLIQGGGAYVNGEKITDPELALTSEHVQDGAVMLRFGKKRFHRLVVRD